MMTVFGALPYDNTGATVQNGEPLTDCFADGTIENSVWFSFIAPPSGSVSISTDFYGSGMQDSQMAVYELPSTDCSDLFNLNQIACNEDAIPTINTAFNAALPPISVTPGQTYFIQIDGFNDGYGYVSEGSFCIVVYQEFPPSNDECDNAAPFGGFGSTTCKTASDLPALQGNLTTIGATATSSLDELSCGNAGLNATVYYSFPFGNDPTAEIEFQLLTGFNVNVAVLQPGCNTSIGVATNNCFTGLNASDPNNNAVLFSGLDPGNNYNLVIWTDQGNATDFDFCMIKRPEGFYECGDGECYTLAESYTNCEFDCPCESSIDLYSYTFGSASPFPTGVCAELIGGNTDAANPGIYIPFVVNTLDSDLTGSFITTSIGTLFTSNTASTAFGVVNPLIPLPNNEANTFVNYLFLTEAEIATSGTITITFTSDNGACFANIDFDVSNIQAPDISECGNCNLEIIPDYTTLQCPGFNLELDIDGAVGFTWLSQNNTTVFDQGDITLPYTGAYPQSDFTLIIYDDGQPNCVFSLTLTFGDYFCDSTNNIATFCRLNPSVDQSLPANCDPATGNILVPINFENNVTGALTAIPNVIMGSGPQGPYTVSVDPNNCAPIQITVSDESDLDFFSGTQILNILSPASIEGGITNVGLNNSDDWGIDISTLGVCGTNTTEVIGDLVLVNDGSDQPTIFCDPINGTPTASQCTGIGGNIALIDRGSCAFLNKASNAQQCGAIAVIVCNNDIANPDNILTMGGTPPPIITIPTILLSYNDCLPIKAALNAGVTACIGAPQSVQGCERIFTVDVCDDYPPGFCQNPDVPGCTDANACNFNPNATLDDGSCIAIGSACDDGDCSTENDTISTNCECLGTPIQCPTGTTFNSATCMCENEGPCHEDISGSVTSPDPLCDLLNINIIITAPNGTTTTVTTDANGNFTVPNGPYPCGIYTAEFEDATQLPECYTNTGLTEPIVFEIDGNPNTNNGPNFVASPTIPTLSQWGLIVLALLLMTWGALSLGTKFLTDSKSIAIS